MTTMGPAIHYSSYSSEPIRAGSADDFGIDTIGSFQGSDLLDIVEDAEVQREYMLPWDYDQKLTNDGWKTVYAVDADIFRFYGDPEDIARRQGSRLGYAEVFRHDSDAGVRTLAFRLADYIFFELQPDCPLIVLPPIDEEVRRIIVALTMELGHEPVPAPIDVETVNDLLASLGYLPGNAPIPEDTLLRLNRILGPRGLARKQTNYLRLSYLLDLRSVVASHSIVESDGFPGPILEVTSRVDHDDALEHAELLGAWLKRFNVGHERGPASRRTNSWAYDASALARLDFWNRRLEKSKCRLVYITGSAHVLTAAGECGTGENNFRHRYVRHPRYFLASPDVVASAGTDIGPDGIVRSQFVEWVRTFLADVEDRKDKDGIGNSQADPVKKAFARVPSLGEKLMRKWRRHMRSLSAAYKPPPPVQRLFQEDFGKTASLKPFTDWSVILSALETRIGTMTDTAWEACFRSATKVGFFVSSANAVSRRTLPPRLVPPLRFDSWPKTDAFVFRMAQWRNADDIDQEEYDTALKEVSKETKEDYKYAYYLAHAALFAARGNWSIGAVLCRRALEQVRDVRPRLGSLGHGREARYLAAHCIRHTARSVRDLDEAERLLAAAKKTYAEEKLFRPALMALPERFEVERLATQLTRYFFGLFSTRPRPHHRDIILTAQRDGVVVGIRASLLSIYKDLADQVFEGPDAGSIRTCLEYEFVRIDANVLFICILLDELHGQLASQTGQRLLERASKGSFYQGVLGRLWGVTRQDVPPRPVELMRLRRDLSRATVRRNVVLAYDADRYGFLASILERERPLESKLMDRPTTR